MSLDIYIISPTPIRKKSTGIWVRDNGKTRELTKAEAEERYPGAVINEVEIETTEFWSKNITNNLNEMATECKCFDDYDLYDLLWRETEPKKSREWYIAHLAYCLDILKDDPIYYERFNPKNGWGDYEQLCEFVEEFIRALMDMPEGSHIEYSL